ncbi:hypothetical protein PMAYCL1PPCAC_05981, partial [Pristionchus mayeri]
QDYISRLNDDCLNNILSKLPRREIHNMSKVSRKMRGMVNNPILDQIKWDRSILVPEEKDGHGFQLSNPENEEYLVYRYAKSRRGERRFIANTLSIFDNQSY